MDKEIKRADCSGKTSPFEAHRFRQFPVIKIT